MFERYFSRDINYYLCPDDEIINIEEQISLYKIQIRAIIEGDCPTDEIIDRIHTVLYRGP
jgi:hypothetical protein